MIPKKLHYCWLSGEPMPEELLQCMKTWKVHFPDYELILWDTRKFDIESNRFVKEAYTARKWAFAADYIRLYALYTEGGIYLDTDVEILKSFDEFLNYDFFTSLEYHSDYVNSQNTASLLNADGSSKEKYTRKPGIGLQAAVLGSIKGHPYVSDCLKWYEKARFIQSDGSYYNTIIAPDIYAMIAEDYGFKYIDKKQELKENMLILPSHVFSGTEDETQPDSYAVHHCANSWRDKPKESLINKVLRKIKRNKIVRFIFNKT